MKNYSSALALAAALALPMSAAQAAVEFGGDFEVNAYSLDMGDLSATGDNEEALQQLLRLRAHFQNEDGVQVNTQISLADTTWEGHEHPSADNESPFSDRHASDVKLDYGYVQIPFSLGVLRVGRQETSWAHGLLVEQERRDRILGITKLGSTTVMAFYDKVDEGFTDADDDVYTANLGATGVLNGWAWGLLGVYNMADGEVAPGVDHPADGHFIFSPWFQGEVAGVTLAGAANISDGLDREALTGGLYEDETGIAVMLRAGVPVGAVDVEGQILYAKDGGIVNQGFDTFSSFINNNPVTNQNPLNVVDVGGPGSENHMVAALRVSGNLTEFFKLQLAAGIVDIDDDPAGPVAIDESGEFYELNAYYQATPSTTIWATVGQLAAEDILGDDITGMSLNLRTEF